ncbi:type II toxin-antitoxin system RelE family toxin [Caenispirillum bisanense]|uniref:type II toxin-antitoxin system RelE family toxin n=1 Tax=Caenispirillum bisanense TaxID=414052 RepID=UPI0031D82A82
MAAIPGPVRHRIIAKVEQYAEAPPSLGNNVKSLIGTDCMRLRVGDYRIIFHIEDGGVVEVMVVLNVKHRREAYD